MLAKLVTGSSLMPGRGNLLHPLAAGSEGLTARAPSQPEALQATAIARVPVPDLCCLWAEGSATPMNIALIGVFEGEPLTDAMGEVRLDRIRAHVAARLHRVPMLRRVLRPTALGQGRPAWIDAAGFDIADHVVISAPGQPPDWEGFLDWCGQRSVVRLPRSRPLWRMDIIPGLPEGEVGMLLVVHHVMADGLRGIAMITGLLDRAPDEPVEADLWRPAPAPTGAALAADNLRHRAQAAAGLAWRLPELPGRLHALMALGREMRSHAPTTSLVHPVGPHRRLVVIRRPLDVLRAGAHARGVTINDLLLAATTTGLRDLLIERADCTEGLVVRASVPAGARGGGTGGVLVVPLPVAEPDLDTCLKLISTETRQRKQHADDGFAAMLTMPVSLARIGVAWARRTAPAHVGLYVSNVPGPPFPLYLAGARLRQAAPLAPLVAGVPLSVTALSYDSVLAVALLADGEITDLGTLAAGVQRSFDHYATGYP